MTQFDPEAIHAGHRLMELGWLDSRQCFECLKHSSAQGLNFLVAAVQLGYLSQDDARLAWAGQARSAPAMPAASSPPLSTNFGPFAAANGPSSPQTSAQGFAPLQGAPQTRVSAPAPLDQSDSERTLLGSGSGSGSGSRVGSGSASALIKPAPQPAGSYSAGADGVFALPEPGQVLGGYTIMKKLGQGGMGAVFLVEQAGQRYALKVITTENPTALARFEREAHAAASVTGHPNIVAIRNFSKDSIPPYIVLDFVDGVGLDDLIKRQETRPALEDGLKLLIKVAHAVEALHEKGILHRDLKPANIMVRRDDGEPMVTDFGLAQVAEGEQLTRSSDMLGTPSYMAPEQAGSEHEDCGPQTDVWALGVMLYELATGQRPFQGDTTLALLKQIMFGEAKLPTKLAPDLPVDVETIILKCLAKDIPDRYASAAEFAADCQAVLDGERIAAIRLSSREQYQRRWRRMTLAQRLGSVTLFASIALSPFFAALYFYRSVVGHKNAGWNEVIELGLGPHLANIGKTLILQELRRQHKNPSPSSDADINRLKQPLLLAIQNYYESLENAQQSNTFGENWRPEIVGLRALLGESPDPDFTTTTSHIGELSRALEGMRSKDWHAALSAFQKCSGVTTRDKGTVPLAFLDRDLQLSIFAAIAQCQALSSKSQLPDSRELLQKLQETLNSNEVIGKRSKVDPEVRLGLFYAYRDLSIRVSQLRLVQFNPKGSAPDPSLDDDKEPISDVNSASEDILSFFSTYSDVYASLKSKLEIEGDTNAAIPDELDPTRAIEVFSNDPSQLWIDAIKAKLSELGLEVREKNSINNQELTRICRWAWRRAEDLLSKVLDADRSKVELARFRNLVAVQLAMRNVPVILRSALDPNRSTPTTDEEFKALNEIFYWNIQLSRTIPGYEIPQILLEFIQYNITGGFFTTNATAEKLRAATKIKYQLILNIAEAGYWFPLILNLSDSFQRYNLIKDAFTAEEQQPPDSRRFSPYFYYALMLPEQNEESRADYDSRRILELERALRELDRVDSNRSQNYTHLRCILLETISGEYGGRAARLLSEEREFQSDLTKAFEALEQVEDLDRHPEPYNVAERRVKLLFVALRAKGDRDPELFKQISESLDRWEAVVRKVNKLAMHEGLGKAVSKRFELSPHIGSDYHSSLRDIAVARARLALKMGDSKLAFEHARTARDAAKAIDDGRRSSVFLANAYLQSALELDKLEDAAAYLRLEWKDFKLDQRLGFKEIWAESCKAPFPYDLTENLLEALIKAALKHEPSERRKKVEKVRSFLRAEWSNYSAEQRLGFQKIWESCAHEALPSDLKIQDNGE